MEKIRDIIVPRPKMPKIYSIINTIEYSGNMGVIVVKVNKTLELTNFGFDVVDCQRISNLDVGGSYQSEDYGNACVVVRMA